MAHKVEKEKKENIKTARPNIQAGTDKETWLKKRENDQENNHHLTEEKICKRNLLYIKNINKQYVQDPYKA